MLEELGARVIDADAIARQVVEPGQPAWHELVGHFGKGILLQDGHIDRQTLGRIAFSDPSKRELLNRATHPYINEAIRGRLQGIEREGCRVAVMDVPLLFETGYETMADEVWVVVASRQTQERRLIEDRGMERDQALARIDAQMPMDEKARRADVVIDSDTGLEQTRQQVIREWERLCERRPEACRT